MMGIYPYAFCNTRFLERVEIPYSRTRNFNYLMVEEYAFSALDLDSGEAKDSSIRQIVFYGTKEEFTKIASQYEGNDAALQAEIVSKPTDFFHDVITYIKIISIWK